MAKIYLAGTKNVLFEFPNLIWDEFVPVVKFDSSSFNRLRTMRIVETRDAIALSDKLEEGKRTISRYSFTVLPGQLTIPFNVERGLGTIDNGGYIEAKVEPATEGVQITSNAKVTAKYGDKFNLDLNILGHQTRTFNMNFYANDDEDLFPGELKDVHCGQIEITVSGSSKVGFRLISNVDSLPNAPLGYNPPNWDTAISNEIALSQKQANQYNNCQGVCYATTVSRAQKAYVDIIGTGVVNLAVSNANVDHRIASTQGGNDPYMGYGAGGPFARHCYGQVIDNDGVWNGELKRGALLQIWHSNNSSDLYSGGGHSVIFRNYLYDDNGDIAAIEYTDYHGGINGKAKQPFFRNYFESNETILGINLLDSKL